MRSGRLYQAQEHWDTKCNPVLLCRNFLPDFGDSPFPEKESETAVKKQVPGMLKTEEIWCVTLMRFIKTAYPARHISVRLQESGMRTLGTAFQTFKKEQANCSVDKNVVSADRTTMSAVSSMRVIRTDLRPMALYDQS